ncbi:MAG: chromosome segregation protein SMC [Candidatus Brocadiia bacterium]
MLLRKIELSGFKSFADRTSFTFGAGLTSIVGPNGSGKSNVVDAVKWVLGEQRIRTLRAQDTTDVIFSGNDERRPLSLAEVSLSLDNRLGRFGSDVDELIISRRLYRDGDSEYLLNGHKVRLKDVREILLGTGLGVNEYSIIEQGKVDMLVQLPPVERRALFDEAAGILLYKEKRAEARSKLQKVNENLARLDDILGEVESQRRSLAQQAARARKFTALKEECDRARLDLYVVRYRVIQEANGKIRAALDVCEQAYAVCLAEFGRLTSEHEQMSVEVTNLREEKGDMQGNLARIDGLSSKYENDLKWHEKRAVELAARCRESSLEIERLTARIAEIDVVIAKARELGSNLDSEKSSRQRLVLERQAQASAMENQANQRRTELRDLEQRRETLRRSKADGEREVARLSAEVDKLHEQMEWLRGEMARNAQRLEALEKAVRDADDSLGHLNEELERAAKNESEAAQRLAICDEEIGVLRTRASESAGELAGLRKRLQILTLIEEKSGKTFAESATTIADHLDIVTGWEVAVEALLGSFISAVLAPHGADPGEGIFARESPEFVPDAEIEFNVGVPCRQLVRCSAGFVGAFGELSAGVRFVEEMPWSLPIPKGVTLVSRKGEIATTHRSIVKMLGTKAEDFVLIRRSEMKVLTARISQMETSDQAAGDMLKQLCTERDQLLTAAAEFSKARRRADVALQIRTEKRGSYRHDQAALRRSDEDIQKRIAGMAASASSAAGRLEVARSAIGGTSDEERGIETRISDMRRTIAELSNAREEVLASLSDAKVGLARAAEKSVSALESVRRLDDERETSSGRERTLRAEIQQGIDELRAGECARTEIRAGIVAAAEEARGLRGKLVDLEGALSGKGTVLERLKSEIAVVDKKIAELRSQREALLISSKENETKLVAASERCVEETGIPLPEESADRQVQTDDSVALESFVAESENKLRSLGSVNLEAVALLEEVEHKHRFMSEQRQDLTKSRDSLNSLIGEMNERCRSLFVDTFQKTKANFSETFRKLFGGGRAELILLDGDVLEAGVEIRVRPPGKEPLSLSLLSGGEKALTAIALILAMFRANPSPFCFLDEVDAPLDDSNVERFIGLLREFSDRSQFILISHNKRTIEQTDAVFGVTIDRSGVSRTVSVKLERDEISYGPAV